MYNNLNIIINSAGTTEFDTRLDIATEINVRGPLLLMQLAQKCVNFEAFVQISTLFAVSDKIGFIDEKIFESRHKWMDEYDRICNSSIKDISENQQSIIGKFPNNYCFSKRLAEEVLMHQ